MKNFIKSIISYVTLIGVPIICVGAVGASAYSLGRDDGEKAILKILREEKFEAKAE